MLDDLLFRDFVLPEERSAITGEQASSSSTCSSARSPTRGLSKGSRADLHLRFARLAPRACRARSCSRSARSTSTRRPAARGARRATPCELAEEAAAELDEADAARSRASRIGSARKLLVRAVELEPTLERRYFAARAAWRLSDMTAVIVEMEEVARRAEAAGERRMQGRALTGSREAVLNQRADAAAARELVERAVEVLADDEPDIRFEAFRAATTIASWLGDEEAFEHWAKLALEAARAAGRKDQELEITMALARATSTARLDRGRASRRAIGELAEESGSVFGRAIACAAAWGSSRTRCAATMRGRVCSSRPPAILCRSSATGPRRRTINHADRPGSRAPQGDLAARREASARGDRTSRASRTTARRSARSQRSSGRSPRSSSDELDEAERCALQARESVGPDDRVSISTTKLFPRHRPGCAGPRCGGGGSSCTRRRRDAARPTQRALERWGLRHVVDFYAGARARGARRRATRSGWPSSLRAARRRSPESRLRPATR